MCIFYGPSIFFGPSWGLSRVDAMAQWEQRYFQQLAKQWAIAEDAEVSMG